MIFERETEDFSEGSGKGYQEEQNQACSRKKVCKGKGEEGGVRRKMPTREKVTTTYEGPGKGRHRERAIRTQNVWEAFFGKGRT